MLPQPALRVRPDDALEGQQMVRQPSGTKQVEDPGTGYRWLYKGELIVEGDEIWTGVKWFPTIALHFKPDMENDQKTPCLACRDLEGAPSHIFEKGYFKTGKNGRITKAEFCRSLIVAYMNGHLVWAKPQAESWGSKQITYKLQPGGSWRSEDGDVISDKQMRDLARRTHRTQS